MKKLLTITAAILTLSSVNVMAADYQKQHNTTNATVGETIDDAKIVTVVNGKLVKDKELSAIQINVDSNKGNVILRGIAPSKTSKSRAEDIAKSVEGVVTVDNQIEVTHNGNTVNNTKNIKNKTENAANTVGNKIDDAAINVAINTKLAGDDDLSSLKINVDVKNGKVWLKGTAPSLQAKNRATQLAKEVEGVKSVHNELTIKE